MVYVSRREFAGRMQAAAPLFSKGEAGRRHLDRYYFRRFVHLTPRGISGRPMGWKCGALPMLAGPMKLRGGVDAPYSAVVAGNGQRARSPRRDSLQSVVAVEFFPVIAA